MMICSCSDETLCLIGNDRDSTSHGVCCLIDDRGGIDGDSISLGVGGLVDNRVNGVKRCIQRLTHFYARGHKSVVNTWLILQKKNKEGEIIYWVQGLCANHEKSLALGERGLEGLDRAKCPSANFNDNVLEPVAASLHAKMVYCNIWDVCIWDGVNCLPATAEEAKRLAEVIGRGCTGEF
jgi:hypothetical protein